MATDFQYMPEIKVAYHNLISQYMILLGQVSEDKVEWGARTVVEDHIRIRMREILKAFTILEYYTASSESEKDLYWLRQEIDFLTRISDQLASLVPYQQRVQSFAWKALILAFSAAVIKYAGSTDRLSDLAYIYNNIWPIIQTLLMYFSLILGIVLLLIMELTVRIKRIKKSYLNPIVDGHDRKKTDQQENQAVSTYDLENQMFQLIKRKKPKELRWDLLTFYIFGGLVLAVYIAWTKPNLNDPSSMLFLLLALIMVIISWIIMTF